MKIKGLTNCAGPGFSLSANQTMLIDDEIGRLLVRDGMAEEVVEDTDPNAGQTDDTPKEDTPDDAKTETTTDPDAGKSETPEKGKGKKVETATVTPPAQTPEK